MDPAVLAMLLLIVGLALLILEFFIPSGGVIGILAAVTLISATWIAHRIWAEDNPRLWYTFLGSVIFLIPSTVTFTLWLMPRTKFGNRILLNAPDLEDVTAYTEESERLEKLVGQRGTTNSLLTPGGLVTVKGERFHCESPGMLIDPNTEVEVVDIRGNRLVVQIPGEPAERIPEESTELPSEDSRISATETNQQESDAPPLDFDIPQG